MTEQTVKPGANAPKGRKFREQSGPMDNYVGKPTEQTKTAEEVMQESHDKTVVVEEGGQTAEIATTTQAGGEKTPPAASQGISVIPKTPVKPRFKRKEGASTIASQKKQLIAERAYSTRLLAHIKAILALADEYKELALKAADPDRQLQIIVPDEALAAEILELQATNGELGLRVVELDGNLADMATTAANLRQQLKDYIEQGAIDFPPLPGADIIAELPEDLVIILSNDGKDPTFLIAGVRGFLAGLYLVMRPEFINEQTGAVDPRHKCQPGDEPESVRKWRALGYHCEVVFGQQMLEDRIAWYQQLEETPMPKV